MASRAISLLLGLGALVFGLLAVFLEPFRDFLLFNVDNYNIKLPFLERASSVIIINHTGEITYIGRHSNGIDHFQNVFYAEDTSGQNRFAPPVPIKHEKGSSIDASRSGAWCPQGTGDILPFTSKVVNISENCLSLRIARPHGTAPDAKLPVMVWIHGGTSALS